MCVLSEPPADQLQLPGVFVGSTKDEGPQGVASAVHSAPRL
jgi:hypothetical protein